MKILKLGIISAVVLFVLVTLLSFLFPGRVRISRASDIYSSRAALLAQLADTAAWRNWFPGADTATTLPEISEKSDSSILVSRNLLGGRRSTMGWNIFATPDSNIFTVQWFMEIQLRWYPWEKFSGLLMEKRYAPTMEKGLEQLKMQLSGGGQLP